MHTYIITLPYNVLVLFSFIFRRIQIEVHKAKTKSEYERVFAHILTLNMVLHVGTGKNLSIFN